MFSNLQILDAYVFMYGRGMRRINSLKATLKFTRNAFSYECDDLINMTNGIVMPKQIQEDIYIVEMKLTSRNTSDL